jgi:lipopolysaccharide export system permease protein
MRILTRYVLQEHAGPFFIGMAAIAFVFLLNTVFRDLGRILGKGLPLIVILKFFGLNFAWI